MEHTRIEPPDGAAALGVCNLPEHLQDTLAAQGLRSLLFAPIPKVARALAGFDRDQLGIAIEVMIAMLDAADPDPDAELEDAAGETVAMVADPHLPSEEGEPDTDLEQTRDEDDWVDHGDHGAGCPIADPGGAGAGEDDEPDGTDQGDISFAEWHTLPAASRRSGRIDGLSKDDWIRTIHEDAEDDDPAGQYDEDCYTGPRPKVEGAGCPIGDPDYEHDGREPDDGY